jgi:hypothetical protein
MKSLFVFAFILMTAVNLHAQTVKYLLPDFNTSIETLFVCEASSQKISKVIVLAEVFRNVSVQGDEYFRPEIVLQSSESSLQSAAIYWFVWNRLGFGNTKDHAVQTIIESKTVNMTRLEFSGKNGNEEQASIKRNGKSATLRFRGQSLKLRNCKPL